MIRPAVLRTLPLVTLVALVGACTAGAVDGPEDEAAVSGSLSGSSATPPAPSSSDPFDPASCVGEPLTAEAIADRFRPGETWMTAGRFAIVTRARACNAVTGCTAWTALTSVRFGNIDGGTHVAALPMSGDIAFEVRGASVVPQLIADTQTPPRGSPFALHTGTGCTPLDGRAGGTTSCTLYGSWSSRNLSPSRYWKVDIAGSYDAMHGVVTDHCIRLSVPPGPHASSGWTDRETVLLGTF